MIVLKTRSGLKMTYESVDVDLYTNRKCYGDDGKLVFEEKMPKDEAFDQIQRCIKAGWKQGE